MWARQQACVGTPSGADEPVEAAQDGGDGVDRLGRRVDADHRVAAAEEQAVDRRQQDAAEVVGGMVRLHADAEHAALAQRVAAAGDVADSLAARTRSLLLISLATAAAISGVMAPCSDATSVPRRRVVEQVLAELADGQDSQWRSWDVSRSMRVEDEARHVVVDERLGRRSRRAARRRGRAWRRRARARWPRRCRRVGRRTSPRWPWPTASPNQESGRSRHEGCVQRAW